jgi:hypothetical protein
LKKGARAGNLVSPAPNRAPRKSLGALFLVLSLVFVGVAAAAGEAATREPKLVVIVVAAAAIALWLGSLAVRSLRPR